MSLRIGVLGPLYVLDGDREVTLSAGKQRVLLAALALGMNRLITLDELADVVWDGRVPTAANATLRNYVKRLRTALGPDAAETLKTEHGAYRLAIPEDHLDLTRFERLCRQGLASGEGDWNATRIVLADALALWRGRPLADIDSQMLRDTYAPRLEQLKIQALVQLNEAELHLGSHEQLIPTLRGLLAENPLHERLHAQLMLALYRCNRQAEALETFAQARSLFAKELGVEPGAQLQDLHRRILAGDRTLAAPPRRVDTVASTAVPRQLPGAVRHFTGRTAELAALTELLSQPGQSDGAVMIGAIGGSAGIGKTALALHWGHENADQFPDGQIYVNLRGFDPAGTPATPASVVRRFLDALAVPPERIPPDPDAWFDLYRSMLADRRMLIVLDNARDAEQVRPLLPGVGGTLVLITSRDRLAALVALDGAVPLTLDLLTADEARELLTRRLGPDRVRREPEATGALIELCARLPLALNIAAAHAAARPGLPLAALAEDLREAHRRLDVLSAGADAADVRAVFSWSIKTLSPAAARMFRLLGLHPGPDISPQAAASLAGITSTQAQGLLAELTRAHLAGQDASGRIFLHDLLRAYAAEQAHESDSETQRDAAIRRTLDHYLITAASAGQLANTTAALPADTPAAAPGVLPEQLATMSAALDWFTDEYRVLLSLVDLAYSSGFDTHAWQLPRALRWYFPRRVLWADWDHTHAIAVRATERLKDPRALALTLLSWSSGLTSSGRWGQAEQHLRRALDLFEELEDLPGQARVLINLGNAAVEAHRYEDAVSCAQRAHDLYRELGQTDGQAGSLANLARCYRHLGDYDRARNLAAGSLDLFTELGNPHGQALAADALGRAHQDLREYPQAIAAHRLAASRLVEVGDTANLAEVLGNVGDACHADGQDAEAAAAYRQALDLLTTLGHPDAARIRAKLAGLPDAAPVAVTPAA